MDLIDVAKHLDSNPKAVLFKNAGGKNVELVGNVVGSRRRVALGFGVPERELVAEVIKRMKHLIPPVEVSSAEAPVQEIVLTGDDADFTRLPAYLQHADDGAPYISAGIDIAVSVDKRRNVGSRRLMLRGRKEAGIDMTAPSDARAVYNGWVERKQPMPIAFAVGSHPTDWVASQCAALCDDEMAVVGALRGSPVPLVRCKTIDLMVPADAEIILEGQPRSGSRTRGARTIVRGANICVVRRIWLPWSG